MVFAGLAFASAFYFAAFVSSFLSAIKRGMSEGAIFWLLLSFGFILHSASILALGLKTGRLPFANSYELLESLSWLLIFLTLFIFAIFRLKLVSTFSVCVAFVLALLPLFCPVFKEHIDKSAQLASNLKSIVGAHAALASLSYSFLALASVFSCMYLLQLRSLKHKINDSFSRALLPLPRLAKFSKYSLSLAILTMALSLALGFVAAFYIELTRLVILKYSAGSLLFLLMLALIFFAAKKDLHEASYSKLCAGLFALAILLMIPIQMRSIFL